MKLYIKSDTTIKTSWSKPYMSDDYNFDGETHKISTTTFPNGSIGVVFYDDYSFSLYDQNGRFIDGDAGFDIKDAKHSCEDLYNTLN